MNNLDVPSTAVNCGRDLKREDAGVALHEVNRLSWKHYLHSLCGWHEDTNGLTSTLTWGQVPLAPLQAKTVIEDDHLSLLLFNTDYYVCEDFKMSLSRLRW